MTQGKIFETGCGKWIKISRNHPVKFYSNEDAATIIDENDFTKSNMDKHNIGWLFDKGTLKFVPLIKTIERKIVSINQEKKTISNILYGPVNY